MSRSVPPGYTGLHSPLRDHWPTQPLVDGRSLELLERWAQLMAVIASRMQQAEQGAAYGQGQADIRTWQRGGDPTSGRLDWGPEQGEQDQDVERPPRIRDPEKTALRKLRDRANDRFAYQLAWLERELREPEQKQAG